MTVTYTAQVATSNFSLFLTLLVRWRGSIYKLLWRDFAAFAFIYYALQFLYRFVLSPDQRKIFELVSRYCESNNALIPVSFVLGFYVSIVMSRWWGALNMIPWPDHMAMFVTANVRGLDERARLMRRTMLRYICLAYTITMSSISAPVKKRFPTFQHLVDAGLMTQNEKEILSKMHTKHNKFFIPLAWTTTLVNRARSEGRIKDDFAVKTLIDEINEFRRCLATLFVYDMISVPLVYTQVVTIAVYMFFIACLMGRQFLIDDDPSAADVDLYFPLFTFLEYFFYMGWLKVAEALINPFGEDEDDFDMNFLIDRNLQVAYLIVDEMHDEHPELVRDPYWDDANCELPYNAASAAFRPTQQQFMGSAMDIRMGARKDSELILSALDAISEGDGSEIYDLEGREDPRHATSPPKKAGRRFSREPSVSSSYRPSLGRSYSRSTEPKLVGIQPISDTGRQSPSMMSKGGASNPVTPRSADRERQFEMDLDRPTERDSLLRTEIPEEIEMKPVAAPRLTPTLKSPNESFPKISPLAKPPAAEPSKVSSSSEPFIVFHKAKSPDTDPIPSPKLTSLADAPILSPKPKSPDDPSLSPKTKYPDDTPIILIPTSKYPEAQPGPSPKLKPEGPPKTTAPASRPTAEPSANQPPKSVFTPRPTMELPTISMAVKPSTGESLFKKPPQAAAPAYKPPETPHSTVFVPIKQETDLDEPLPEHPLQKDQPTLLLYTVKEGGDAPRPGPSASKPPQTQSQVQPPLGFQLEGPAPLTLAGIAARMGLGQPQRVVRGGPQPPAAPLSPGAPPLSPGATPLSAGPPTPVWVMAPAEAEKNRPRSFVDAEL